jgi:hypothetical protein
MFTPNGEPQVSIQRKKSDGTCKLIGYGIMGSIGVMLLMQMLIRFGACR